MLPRQAGEPVLDIVPDIADSRILPAATGAVRSESRLGQWRSPAPSEYNACCAFAASRGRN